MKKILTVLTIMLSCACLVTAEERRGEGHGDRRACPEVRKVRTENHRLIRKHRDEQKQEAQEFRKSLEDVDPDQRAVLRESTDHRVPAVAPAAVEEDQIPSRRACIASPITLMSFQPPMSRDGLTCSASVENVAVATASPSASPSSRKPVRHRCPPIRSSSIVRRVKTRLAATKHSASRYDPRGVPGGPRQLLQDLEVAASVALG